MKDLIGQEITVGQVVAFNPPYYKGLTVGKVVGFTPKMVKVEYTVPYGDNDPETVTTTNSPADIAVLDEKAVLMHILSKE